MQAFKKTHRYGGHAASLDVNSKRPQCEADDESLKAQGLEGASEAQEDRSNGHRWANEHRGDQGAGRTVQRDRCQRRWHADSVGDQRRA